MRGYGQCGIPAGAAVVRERVRCAAVSCQERRESSQEEQHQHAKRICPPSEEAPVCGVFMEEHQGCGCQEENLTPVGGRQCERVLESVAYPPENHIQHHRVYEDVDECCICKVLLDGPIEFALRALERLERKQQYAKSQAGAAVYEVCGCMDVKHESSGAIRGSRAGYLRPRLNRSRRPH